MPPENYYLSNGLCHGGIDYLSSHNMRQFNLLHIAKDVSADVVVNVNMISFSITSKYFHSKA